MLPLGPTRHASPSRALCRVTGVYGRRPGGMTHAQQCAIAACLGIALAGCSVPIAGTLDEAQANRVLVALEHVGIGSEKEPDPAAEGRFRIVVLRDEAPRALAVLHDEGLPIEPTPSLLDSVGKGSILPSPMAEHTQFVAGLAGELERTLSSVDGVLFARVHLSLPWRDALSDAARPKASASVLIKHRADGAAIDADSVRRLVAGAAPSLAPDDVAVVLLARPSATVTPEQALARFGPVWVSRGSISALRFLTAVCIFLDLALFGMVMVLWTRARRLRALVLSREPQEPAQGRAPT